MSAKVPVPIRAATTAEPGLKRKDIHSEGGKEHENSFFERGYRITGRRRVLWQAHAPDDQHSKLGGKRKD